VGWLITAYQMGRWALLMLTIASGTCRMIDLSKQSAFSSSHPPNSNN